MRTIGLTMKVDCSVSDILSRIRANRSKHLEMFEEARKGFLEKAKSELGKRLAIIESGKTVSLRIDLEIPRNHVAEYDTVIRMLELHRDPKIELSANEVRMFVEDKWDWTDSFLSMSSSYTGRQYDHVEE